MRRPLSSHPTLSRRRFLSTAGSGLAAASITNAFAKPAMAATKDFRLNYILGSPMYGTTPLAEVIAEAPKVGAKSIDIWPRSHANHREQMDEMGHDKVAELLADHNVRLGMITRYDLGPFRLGDEMPILQRFGGKLLVCGAKNASGETEKARVAQFVEDLKPHVERAASHDITIGIENHSGSLLHSIDSIKYFAEFAQAAKLASNLGLAMAPYHLPQDPELIGKLIRSIGAENLAFFQAWQHGDGCMKKLPKQQELLQMPGRGPLEFKPILAALKETNYDGWTEIFMHPVPRGIPILKTTKQVTDEINRSREYLANNLQES